ncbi:MAG: hypothetical protein P4L46_14120 [Fimbriimonas sp.]|nr:hypothetical protein [Fimbriimonas sp.]
MKEAFSARADNVRLYAGAKTTHHPDPSEEGEPVDTLGIPGGLAQRKKGHVGLNRPTGKILKIFTLQIIRRKYLRAIWRNFGRDLLRLNLLTKTRL